MNKLYSCYSVELRNYLISNGERYELVGLNPNSKKMFWAFIKNENLNRLLSDWSRLK